MRSIPLLTPVTIDPSHPFPRVLNKALCIALLAALTSAVARPGRSRMGTVLGVVTVPRAAFRGLSRCPRPKAWFDFIFLHELIESQVERMFRGYEVLWANPPFGSRVTATCTSRRRSRARVLESVRAELHNRRKGDVPSAWRSSAPPRQGGHRTAARRTSSWTSRRSSRPTAPSTSRG